MHKLLLAAALLLLLGCTKSRLGPGPLAPGTQCNLVSGVFEPGQYQPAPPLTIQSIFLQTGDFIIYNAVDANGVTWQIPSEDLQLIK